jgi:hypothetical protein
MRPHLLAERALIAQVECRADPSLNGPAHWMAMGVWDCVNVALFGPDEYKIGAYASIYAAALSQELATLEGTAAPFVTVDFHPSSTGGEGAGTFMWSRAGEKDYEALKKAAQSAHEAYHPRSTLGLELVARA